MPSPRSLAATLALLAAVSGSSCRKRPAGTCAEDIDCPAGYDCRAGACVKRPPAPGAVPAPPVAAPVEQPLAPTEVPPLMPGPTDASRPADGSASTAPPKRKARPPSPVAPPPPMPPAPPEGPLPMWKQRLKNS